MMVNKLAYAIGVLSVALACDRASAGYVPSVSGGTGAYHRVYSDTGYSYMSATVYLPGSSQIKLSGTDTPYVYTGGWGDLNGNGAVDAGFQYSPTYNNWALFARGAGHSQTSPTNGDRFLASEAVSLTFAVVASATPGVVNLVVTATGTDAGNAGNHYVGNGQTITESVTLAVNTATYGWSVGSLNTNTLKRVTSIAQTKENLLDGSTISGVVWSNVVIGQSAADATAWSGGGSQSYPGTPGVVNVNYIDAANETDGISLVPEPKSWALLVSGQILIVGLGWRRLKDRRAAVASPH